MVASPTNGYAASQRELRSDGLLVTLGALIAIEVLTRTVFRVPTPGAMLGTPARSPGNPAWPDPSATAATDGVFWRKDGISFPVEYLLRSA
jgi:hypothetical protein